MATMAAKDYHTFYKIALVQEEESGLMGKRMQCSTVVRMVRNRKWTYWSLADYNRLNRAEQDELRLNIIHD